MGMGVQFFGSTQVEEFGDFTRAMFTMWQVMSCDSWVSQIARTSIFTYNAGVLGGFFYISYLFIAGIVMINVVVAILLDKYLGALEEIRNEEEKNQNNIDNKDTDLNKSGVPPELSKLNNSDLKRLLKNVLQPDSIK